MAFNFKWSPLAADASFYSRAQDLLTTALNKSPKPPIIVDDIIVTELNLGSLPPDLEVLEIGDLDVDRFRGIFKMCYNGNAFLTLKTKVQANPLNTYLSTKPKWASPEPLAASSGLTIPIQMTLSDIKLSAFIILVYSNQKGLTLVFRNDPLESLKVSSTFDGIPFVRDYLQKEIESQLRTLLMDELPLIIHRLSLQLFNNEEAQSEDRSLKDGDEKPVDPLASPPQDPVDAAGNVLDTNEIASLSLDPGAELHTLFSRKNLLRLETLNSSHRTLSLFTPSIPDAIFRVGAFSRENGITSSGRTTPPLLRSQSYHGAHASLGAFSPSPTEANFSRQPLQGVSGKPRRRKRKHRVVNLRKKAVEGDDVGSVSGESTTTGTESVSAPSSAEPPPRPKTPEQQEPGDTDWGQTPPQMKRHVPKPMLSENWIDDTPRQSQFLPPLAEVDAGRTIRPPPSQAPGLHALAFPQADERQGKEITLPSAIASSNHPQTRQLGPSPLPSIPGESSQGMPASDSKLAEADKPGKDPVWLNQIASQILRKVHDQQMQQHSRKQETGSNFSSPSRPESSLAEDPPPAYMA